MMKLAGRALEKPWGLAALPSPFSQYGKGRIGEIIFADPSALADRLMVKFIFTSEKLSVRVHPDDALAQAKGLPHGKSECWYILEADAEAAVALGFRNSIDLETARAAALDGSIEDLLNWTRVSSGDFLYVPAGTVHAIGAGIKLLEIQQNIDVTYRLYDYGRPRELHLEDALAVAKLHPAHSSFPKTTATETFELLVSSPHFSVLRIGGAAAGADVLLNRGRWIVPLRGSLLTPDGFAEAGDCMFLMPGEGLQGSDDAMFIVAVEGSLL